MRKDEDAMKGGKMSASYDPQKRYRRSTRLQGYDYSQPGAYYVTICVRERRKLFGDIVDGEMRLNEVGKVAEWIWKALPQYFPSVEVDQFVVMPNHLHGILVLSEAFTDVPMSDPGTSKNAISKQAFPMTMSSVAPTLGQIIRKFKALTSYYLHAVGAAEFAWQERYYEHVVRNDQDLKRIREYIVNNPARWAEDDLYLS
jgi:REP element-mobilizing transposase RayT